MFCVKCGKEVKNGAKFCGFCGAPVKAENANLAPEQSPKERKGGGFRGVLEGIGGIIMVVAAIFAALIMHG